MKLYKIPMISLFLYHLFRYFLDSFYFFEYYKIKSMKMKIVLFPAVVLFASYLPFPLPSFGQQIDESCVQAERKVLERLARDNVLPVDLSNAVSLFKTNRTGVILRAEELSSSVVSPTNRSRSYFVSFAGKRAYDFLNSPQLLRELSRTLINSCEQVAVAAFWLHASGYSVVYGLEANGEIKIWGCYEDIGFFPRRRKNEVSGEPPSWGYRFCSI